MLYYKNFVSELICNPCNDKIRIISTIIELTRKFVKIKLHQPLEPKYLSICDITKLRFI